MDASLYFQLTNFRPMLHAFPFISNTFISNTQLKLTKNQAEAKKHNQAELLLFENDSLFSSTLSSKNNSVAYYEKDIFLHSPLPRKIQESIKIEHWCKMDKTSQSKHSFYIFLIRFILSNVHIDPNGSKNHLDLFLGISFPFFDIIISQYMDRIHLLVYICYYDVVENQVFFNSMYYKVINI